WSWIRRLGPRASAIARPSSASRGSRSASCLAEHDSGIEPRGASPLLPSARRELIGDRREPLVLEADLFVRIRLLEQRPKQQVVQPVTGLEARELAEQRSAEEVQVPDRVEHLVPDELVAEAQAVFV